MDAMKRTYEPTTHRWNDETLQLITFHVSIDVTGWGDDEVDIVRHRLVNAIKAGAQGRWWRLGWGVFE
jgi:hypothetical protein